MAAKISITLRESEHICEHSKVLTHFDFIPVLLDYGVDKPHFGLCFFDHVSASELWLGRSCWRGEAVRNALSTSVLDFLQGKVL